MVATTKTSWSGLVDQYGQRIPSPAAQRRRRALQAKYDSAATNDDNRRHWANADLLSADAAADPQIRRTIRSRARYEAQESNAIAKGISLTIANDTIGAGPRLQLLTKDRAANRRVEAIFAGWSRAIGLARKLWTMRLSKLVDGEIFLQAVNNPRLANTQLELDCQLVEADQIADPYLWNLDPLNFDGIKLDQYGNVDEYRKLKAHPGDRRRLPGGWNEFDPIPAEQMVHWFRCDRPGQRRGVSEIATALPLFALLRRYTLAVLAAAETAAEWAAVLYTDATAEEGPDSVEPLDVIELEMRAMLSLPAGWKIGQVKPEQPATTYEMFRNAIINEIARCVNMPTNKALGDSSGYNYASGRLDHQTYFAAIAVERADCEQQVLSPLLGWFLDEAALIPGLLPDNLGPLGDLPYRWYWPAHKHVDPLKEAMAVERLWDLGLLTDDHYLFDQGIDPEAFEEQHARQRERRQRLGLPLPGESDRAPMEITEGAEA